MDLEIFWPVEIFDSHSDTESLVFLFRGTRVSQLYLSRISWFSRELTSHLLHWLAVELDILHQTYAFLHGYLTQHFRHHPLLKDAQSKHVRSVWSERTE